MPEAMPMEWAEWAEWKGWICNSRSELPLSEDQSPAPAGLFVSGAGVGAAGERNRAVPLLH